MSYRVYIRMQGFFDDGSATPTPADIKRAHPRMDVWPDANYVLRSAGGKAFLKALKEDEG
jgi:hypothetical protein